MNGKVLAQKTCEDILYFQYDENDIPVGFVLNDTQYFYITNLSGDIVGITDSSGELIAEYSYDEWGKLLSITTSQENNAEQLAIAEINPLRYRGYYYDTETGYYYLQSRYYDLSICKFINADLPEYAQMQKDEHTGNNLFAYCGNNPMNIWTITDIGKLRFIMVIKENISIIVYLQKEKILLWYILLGD